MLMIAFVNKTPKDEVNNDTSFHFVINFQNETECNRNWHFQKNVKTCQQNNYQLMERALS